jgi:hypothetical protein
MTVGCDMGAEMSIEIMDAVQYDRHKQVNDTGKVEKGSNLYIWHDESFIEEMSTLFGVKDEL